MCEHEWVEKKESDLGGDRVEVICINCGEVGEKNTITNEVFHPAT